MSINPWIDYLKIPELDEFLSKAGYEKGERVTPRAICCDPVYTRLGFIVVKSGALLWHPQYLTADLSVVLEYWKTHSQEPILSDLNHWDSQLRGRTAEFAGHEIVHLYTSSGNKELVIPALKLLLDNKRIHSDAIILNEPGDVLGLLKDLVRNT